MIRNRSQGANLELDLKASRLAGREREAGGEAKETGSGILRECILYSYCTDTTSIDDGSSIVGS